MACIICAYLDTSQKRPSFIVKHKPRRRQRDMELICFITETIALGLRLQTDRFDSKVAPVQLPRPLCLILPPACKHCLSLSLSRQIASLKWVVISPGHSFRLSSHIQQLMSFYFSVLSIYQNIAVYWKHPSVTGGRSLSQQVQHCIQKNK